MTGLRERIAEALDAFFAADVTTWNIEELADAVMVEVQRDLDELEAAVPERRERPMSDPRPECVHVVENTIMTLAQECDALGKSWGWRKDAAVVAQHWAKVLEVLIPLYGEALDGEAA